MKKMFLLVNWVLAFMLCQPVAAQDSRIVIGNEAYELSICDMDGDGKLTVADIAALIDLYLTGEEPIVDEKNNQFTLSLPEEAPVSEVFVKAYGAEVTPDSNHDYATSANVVSVVDGQGRMIYDCCASLDTVNVQRTLNLNALETAYSLLLPVFPNMFETTSDRTLNTLKSLLSELSETHALAAAIDRSIVNCGYLDMESIDTEYQAAVDRIVEKLGLRDNYLKAETGARRRLAPKAPAIVNGDGVWGLKLVMNSSEWVENASEKYWKCNLTAYNSNRFAYTAWIRGCKGDDGYAHYNEDATYDLVRERILKPQRVSTFMENFTDPITKPFKKDSWEGLANYFSDTYRLFTEEGFWFDDMTWDNTKKTFDMDFTTPRDVVIVAGPADDRLMNYYNVAKAIFTPMMKAIMKGAMEAEDEDYLLNFSIDMVTDPIYWNDFLAIMVNDNKGWGTKAKEIATLTWPKMSKHLDGYIQEKVKTKSSQWIWDHYGFTRAGELQKAVEDISDNWNVYLKKVEKYGDIALGVLGLTEGSYYYDLSLDFGQEEHEAVDLGLSVKWATMNVGASAPEEYGDYFAWGETEPKDYYDWETYRWCKGSDDNMTKYCTDSDYGTVDNKTVLDLEDDAAHANWGGTWRMPTEDEFTELRTKCTWEWTTQNGVNGRKVTGPNGNSIFLPAAGDRWNDRLYYAGRDGDYWSSSLYPDDDNGAYGLNFDSGGTGWSYGGRDSGHSVRAVCP